MSSRDDIVGILGAVLSTILAALGFLWSIGFLQLMFTFLTGAFTTYVVQHRLQVESEKRERTREHALEMRDEIYGPIFAQLSKILVNVEEVKSSGWGESGELKGITADYLFFTINDDLKRRLSELIDRIEKYGNILRAAQLMVQKTIRTEVINRYQNDIDTNEDTPDISLRIGVISVAYTNLKYVLFCDINPREFVKSETQKWGEDVTVEISVRGNRGPQNLDMDQFESVCSSVRSAVEGHSLFTEEKKQRRLLIDALKAYLKEIQPFVNLE